jgi:uncharacterized membrane protein
VIFIKSKFKTRELTLAAAIAALYVCLTYLSAILGLSSGVIQLRFSEAMCILPIYTQAAIPGLFVGCIISNLLAGGVITDVIFGSIATLIGAVGTRMIGEKHKILALLPPILSNTVIIPFVLRYAYGAEDALIFMFFTVGIGEMLSCGVLGTLLDKTMKKALAIRDKHKD